MRVTPDEPSCLGQQCGPGEALAPWWIESTAPASDPSQRYLHRERALYLPRAVFARGHAGDRDLLRDPDLLRGLRNAPLVRRPLPIPPGREGIGAPRGLSRAAAEAVPPRPKPVRRATPAPAPTPAGAASSAPARPKAPASPAPNGPPAAAPPWPDEGRRPEPRPRVAGESAAEPRGTTSSAPPWGVSSTPAPVPRDQIPASKRRR